MTETCFRVGELAARRLTEADLPRVQALLESCEDYHRMVSGGPASPAEAREAFASLPPGKHPEDKYLLGLQGDDGILMGLIDLVRGYPEPDCWFLGLLLLDPARRSRGLGERVHEAMRAWAREAGAVRLRLGVVAQNEGGCRFWLRRGYRELYRTEVQVGEQTNETLVMERLA